MAKSEQHFFKDKKPLPQYNNYTPSNNEVRIPKQSRKKIESSVKVIDNSESMVLMKGDEKIEEEEDNIGSLMYERALEESIESLQKILGKIELAVGD